MAEIDHDLMVPVDFRLQNARRLSGSYISRNLTV